MLDARVYDIEYLDIHKGSLSANTMSEIYFHKLTKKVIHSFYLMT